jgi:hypothetical protein
VTELPLDLVGDSVWTVGGGEPGRLGGVRGSTQRVRAHVGNGCGLPGCPGGSRRRRSGHLACGAASEEATPDLIPDIELTTGESPRSGDGVAGTAIDRSFRSNSHSTRWAQSAAHPATIRRSASLSVCGEPTPR